MRKSGYVTEELFSSLIGVSFCQEFIFFTLLVQTEEKMRQLHEQKLRLLKHLDEKGAESDKIITIQAKVKKLATRIGVAIQVIDLISQRISIIRDEELWPLLHELIQGYEPSNP